MFVKRQRATEKQEKAVQLGTLSLEGLQGRQSVRATFQLPEKVIAILGVVAAQFGVKQKSLLDTLLEDSEALRRIADKDNSREISDDERRRKTFVMSKRTLKTLEETAQKSKLPRDRILEISISQLFPVVEEEKQKHRKRLKLDEDFRQWIGDGQNLLRKAEQLLGKDDAAYRILAEMVNECKVQQETMALLLERGRSMANLDLKESEEDVEIN